MENQNPIPVSENKSYFEKFAHPDYFNKKHPANIMLILLVLIFIGFVLLIYPYFIPMFQPAKTIQQQTTQTKITPPAAMGPNTNWKTYTNDRYGLSFKYPADASVHTDEVVYVDGVITKTPNTIQLLSKTPNFILTLQLKPGNNQSLATLIASDSPSLTQNKSNPIIVAKETGKLYANQLQGAYGPVTGLYFLHNNVFYKATVEGHDDFSTYENIAGQILSTFKFTN